jgi:hypothetical protein
MDRNSIWQNQLSIAGAVLAVLSALFFVAFQVIGFLQPMANPYVGIWTFLVLPIVLVLGLILIPAGYVRERQRRRRLYPEVREWPRFPTFDPNDPRQLRGLLVFVAGTLVVLVLIGISSYEGYHYTDSTQFCGQLCHTVMEPEYTAYTRSPHARVSCAECHIGPGASWFVKSKITGVRQVWAVASHTYPTPIPTPIQDLRPARETCEQCHWPAKFYASQMRERVHFSSDQDNTRSVIRILLKTGGADSAQGPPSGIHWHMALSQSIEYIATDQKRQQIPYLVSTDVATGRQTVYRSDGKPSDAPPPAGERRHLDCMDCHNRPTHIIQSPDAAVDASLAAGRLDSTLPYVKKVSVEALIQNYTSVAQADSGIASYITGSYSKMEPQIPAGRANAIAATVEEVRAIYRQNFFPEMKVSWKVYTNNIGHMIFAGCFRCHDEKHVSTNGAIHRDCTICHDFLLPVQSKPTEIYQEVVPAHPVKLVGIHEQLECAACHTGGPEPVNSCEGCHDVTAAFRQGTVPRLSGVEETPSPMAALDCESCHADLSRPQSQAVVAPQCEACHEKGFGDMIQAWKNDASANRQDAAAAIANLQNRGRTNQVPRDRSDAVRALIPQLQNAVDQIDTAGPWHNIGMADAAYAQIVKLASDESVGATNK